jgi:hypothetical protein
MERHEMPVTPHHISKIRCNAPTTKSREVIRGSRIGAGKINAERARQRAKEAAREADRAELMLGRFAWLRRACAAVSPIIGQCINGGLGCLEMEYNAARPGRACRSTPSAGRGIRRSGSLRRR